MFHRSRKGAVLGLVVVTCLVLLIMGIGFLLLIMQLGGGQELQHATDAGNLNVAKQSLRNPGTPLLLGDEKDQLADLDDPETNEVNLQTYNRLVAQAYLVKSNSLVLGTGDATLHSKQLISLVEGVANRLNNELSTANNFDQHFHKVAQGHAMRMFQAVANPVTHITNTHSTSCMARGRATNVSLSQNQILPGGGSVDAVSVTGPDGGRYLVGYQQVAATAGKTLWGVPLRPGEPPHLVSPKTFDENNPRGPIPNFVPPNAFRSGGRATDKIASGNDVGLASHAIVGSLQAQFPAQIPRGVILVDNTGKLDGVKNIGGFDIWQDKLMSPNYVEVLGGNASTGLIADQSAGNNPTLGDVKDYVDNNYNSLMNGDTGAINALTNLLNNSGVDSYGSFPSNPAGNAADSNFINFVHNSSVSQCTNGSPEHAANPPTTMAMSGGQPCNLEKFIDLYGQPKGNNNGTQQVPNLMAVEKFHVDLCSKRAGGNECVNVNAPPEKTGLKKYNLNDCGLTQVRLGTLNELLIQTRVANSVRDQMRVYMRQMKPGASNAEMNAVFATLVPFGIPSFIYRNPSTNMLLLTAAQPPWPLPDLSDSSQHLPDGNPQTYKRGNNPFVLDGITNCNGECGYPHPWDCPMNSQSKGQDTTVWTPSSGWRNILGVVKFINEAFGGGKFCCPC
ncbi:MAG: hypothetical protein K2Z81_07285 [Cyanobacteria bacterium]|nr:hypothetical protein [Cyanobacteriota bacterium]